MNRIFLVLAFASLSVGGARADQILVNQPAQSPLQNAADGNFSGTSDFSSFETFSLSQASTIDSITWQGSYASGSGLTPTAADATGFNVLLFQCRSTGCGLDAIPVFDEEITPTQANETLVGSVEAPLLGSSIGPFVATVYNYQTTFATPIDVDAGTYILLLGAQIPDFGTLWFWDAGTGGDGVSYLLETPTLAQQNFDLAFSVLGTTDGTSTPVATPEPSNLVLLGTGLIGIAAGARRRLAG